MSRVNDSFRFRGVVYVAMKPKVKSSCKGCAVKPGTKECGYMPDCSYTRGDDVVWVDVVKLTAENLTNGND